MTEEKDERVSVYNQFTRGYQPSGTVDRSNPPEGGTGLAPKPKTQK